MGVFAEICSFIIKLGMKMVFPTRLVAALLACVIVFSNVAFANEELKEQVTKSMNCPTEIMHNLPHHGIALQSVDADLGAYSGIIASGEDCGDGLDDNVICTDPDFEELLADPLTYVQNGLYRSDPENIANYVEHIVLYIVIGIFLAVGTILSSIVYCFMRCCGSKCTPDTTKKYNTRQVLTTYFLLGTFVISTFTLVSIGHFKGNVGFTQCQLALASSPTNTAKMIQNMISPLKNSTKQVIGVTVPTSLKRINQTLNDEVDFRVASVAIECISTLVSATSGEVIESFQTIVSETVASVEDLPDLGAVTVAIEQLEVNATALVAITSQVQSDIDSIQTHLASTRDTVVLVGSRVSTLEGLLTTMSSQLDDVKLEAQAIVNLEDSLVTTKAALNDVVTIPYTNAILSAAESGITDSIEKANAASPASLATDLDALNSTIDDVDVQIGFLIVELGLAATSVQDQSTITTLNSTLDSALAAIDAFDVTVLVPITNELSNSVSSSFGPSAGAFATVFETLTSVEDQVACATQLFDVLVSIDQGIVQLPDFISSIQDAVSNLNDTISSAFSNVDSISSQFNSTDQLDQVTDMVNSVNETISDVQSQLSAARQVVVNAKAQISESASSSSGTTDFAQIISDMETLQSDLRANALRPSPNDITSLNDGQTSLDSTKATFEEIDGIMDNLLLLPASQSFTCADSGGSPSGTLCYDYSGSPLLPVKDAASTCATEVSGSPGCLFPYEKFDNAISGISDFQAKIASMDASLSGSVIPGIDSAKGDIANTDLSCCDNQVASIDDMGTTLSNSETEVESSHNDLNSQLSTFTDIKSSVDSAQTTLDGLNSTLSAFGEQLSSLNATIAGAVPEGTVELLNFANDVVKLFSGGSVLEAALSSISISELDKIDAGSGGDRFFEEASMQFARSLDSILGVFNDSSSPMTTAIQSAAETFKLLDTVNGLANADAEKTGPLHLFATLVTSFNFAPPPGIGDTEPNGGEHSPPPDNPMQPPPQNDFPDGPPSPNNDPNNDPNYDPNKDPNYDPNNDPNYDPNNDPNYDPNNDPNYDPNNDPNYDPNYDPNNNPNQESPSFTFEVVPLQELEQIESDKLQLLGYIDSETGDFLSYSRGRICVTSECIENSIHAMNSEPLSVGGTDLPLSRETFMFIPFLLPIFLALIAIAACFCSACSTPLYLCSLCMSPIIFLVAGGVFFPITFIPSDVCVSMESVIGAQVAVLNPMICGALNGTVTSPGMCGITLDGVPGLSKGQVEINFEKTIEAALLTCDHKLEDGSNPGAEFLELLDTNGREELADMITSFVEASNLTIRADLREDFDITANLLVSDILNLLASVMRAAGCAPLQEAYYGFKDAVCCDCVGALYYWVSAWYLIGFSMICCACPGGLLSVSRLHNHQRDKHVVSARRSGKGGKGGKPKKGSKKARSKKAAVVHGRQVGHSQGTEDDFDGLPVADNVPRMVSIPRTQSNSPTRRSRPKSTNGTIRRSKTTAAQSPIRTQSTNQRPSSLSRVSQQQYDNIARSVSQNAAGANGRVVYVVPGRRQQNNPNVVSALI